MNDECRYSEMHPSTKDTMPSRSVKIKSVKIKSVKIKSVMTLTTSSVLKLCGTTVYISVNTNSMIIYSNSMKLNNGLS